MSRGPRRRSPGDAEAASLPTSGTITAITAQQRDPERVNVFLDGVYTLALTREASLQHDLRIGRSLSVDEVGALRAIDDVAKATEAAIRLLTVRARAEGELRTSLRGKGYDAETIDAAIARLHGWGYLDDADFARAWVANRDAHRPRGSRLLAQELGRKGVDRTTIAVALDDAGHDDAAAAIAAARKQAPRLSALEPEVARRRLAGHLARRGFAWPAIAAALKVALPGGGDDLDELDLDDADADADGRT